ncbi:PRC-barrel domain-containing protein [uncultured Maritimibacter sp.]|uniref:PRC-barrel domain-containing protein n=1 Tax=uncultured Maritimibacter sp. TaxID=991866 RepID=UPI0025968A68|nr:PRC-barrel domain-containing protein [uncultured Maritimibacter sp.]
MKPLNKTLMTSAAALVLVAGSAFAQDVSTDTEVTGDVATEGTTMNSDTSTSTDMEATGDDMTADAEMHTETELESDIETAAEETGEAIENTAEDVADAAENAAEEAGDEMEEMAADAEAEVDGEIDGEMSADASAMDSDLEAAADVEISSLIGVNVVSQDGNDVGEVDNFYMLDNKVWAVIGIGGFLGIGEHDVAIDLEHLAVNETSDEGEVTEFMITGYTEADLEAMEEFDSETATVIDSTSSLRAASGS